MSSHKAFIANGVFPRFTSTAGRYRNFAGGRAARIASLVKASGADCATFNELGKPECAELASHLPGWQYDRAQGTGIGTNREGLNSVWTKTSVWSQPEDDVSDYDMPSNGQWVRTFLMARISEIADPTAFMRLGAFHETLGNAAGLAYVKTMISKVGDRRVLLGGDFKRTGDTDDLVAMARAGLTVHERTSSTPMTCFTKGSVRVSDVDHRTDARCFDHGYLVTTFTIPNTTPKD